MNAAVWAGIIIFLSLLTHLLGAQIYYQRHEMKLPPSFLLELLGGYIIYTLAVGAVFSTIGLYIIEASFVNHPAYATIATVFRLIIKGIGLLILYYFIWRIRDWRWLVPFWAVNGLLLLALAFVMGRF